MAAKPSATTKQPPTRASGRKKSTIIQNMPQLDMQFEKYVCTADTVTGSICSLSTMQLQHSSEEVMVETRVMGPSSTICTMPSRRAHTRAHLVGSVASFI